MTSITDNIRDLVYRLLLQETQMEQTPLRLPALRERRQASLPERQLQCSMQQLQAAASEVSRLLSENPQLARQWRAELLQCGRDINFSINQATSRRTLTVEEHHGRAP